MTTPLKSWKTRGFAGVLFQPWKFLAYTDGKKSIIHPKIGKDNFRHYETSKMRGLSWFNRLKRAGQASRFRRRFIGQIKFLSTIFGTVIHAGEYFNAVRQRRTLTARSCGSRLTRRQKFDRALDSVAGVAPVGVFAVIAVVEHRAEVRDVLI